MCGPCLPLARVLEELQSGIWRGLGRLRQAGVGLQGPRRSHRPLRLNEHPKAEQQRNYGKTLSTVVYKRGRLSLASFLRREDMSLEGKLGKPCASLGHEGSNPHHGD